MTFPVPSPEQVQITLGLPERPVELGRGGFKVVYKAKTREGSFEALKAIHIPLENPEQNDSERHQLLARAFREIEVLRSSTFSGLVRLGSIQAKLRKIEGEEYLVYSEELLEGSSLNGWIEAPSHPTRADLEAVFRMLIATIRELSSLGYLHRDIKPENIMETGQVDRRFVVIDLGIAYKIQGTQLTGGGGPPGTLCYMAPELLSPAYKDTMDFRCDLYSAALTVYVLATGNQPFARRLEDMRHTAFRVLNDRPIPLCNIRHDLPSEFCRIIDRCLRKKPALRYSTLELVEAELDKVSP